LFVAVPVAVVAVVGRVGMLVVARVARVGGGRGDEGVEAGSTGAGGGRKDSNFLGRAMLSSMVVFEKHKGQRGYGRVVPSCDRFPFQRLHFESH